MKRTIIVSVTNSIFVVNVARVYAILSVQLFITAISIGLFGLYPNIGSWMKNPNSGGILVPIVSLLISTITWLLICISPNLRRISPMKWYLLSFFTVGEAISVGYVSSFYQFRSVVSAMLVTALSTTVVSYYTTTQKNSKYDLSQWGVMLSSTGLIFMLYGFVQILQFTNVLPSNFLPYNEMLYGIIGAVLFSCYLAYHTKLITGGKHTKYQMNEQDYVYGASKSSFCCCLSILFICMILYCFE